MKVPRLPKYHHGQQRKFKILRPPAISNEAKEDDTKPRTNKQPTQRQIANEFKKNDDKNNESDIVYKQKTSPSQDRRSMFNLLQDSNKPMISAIERLTKLLEDKLDKAIISKEANSPITSTKTRIQPSAIHEEIEPIEDDRTDSNKEPNPFEPMDDDAKTKQTRMNKLKIHQNKLTQMSNDLTEELDNVSKITSQTNDTHRLEDQKLNAQNNTNIFRNLSITITSLEQKIQTLEKKHDTEIKELRQLIENKECQLNHHQPLTKPDDPPTRNPSLRLQLSESDNNDEKEESFTTVKNKK